MPVFLFGDEFSIVLLITVCAAVFVLTLAMIWGLRWLAPSVSLVDLPNHRSLHQKPIPKVGGVAIICVAGAAALLLAPNEYRPLVLVAGMLMAVSAWDDVRNLSAALRLSTHSIAAVAFVVLYPVGSWLFACLTIVTIVWMVNLYNFMDGADGLAGGMAVLGFGIMGFALFGRDLEGLGTVALLISVAALAFLCFNFPPATIFMGDAGSVPLGFLAAAIGYLGYLSNAWPYWYPALIFSPFILDATFTLLRRALRGERLWSAHREHLYQRLILAGWSHRRLALVAYGIMLTVSAVATLALGLSEVKRIITALSALILLIVLFLLAERYLAKRGERARI